MKAFLEFYNQSDHVIFFSFILTLLFILLMIISFAITFQMLPNEIPLFYSLPWGDDQIARLPQFALLPFIAGTVAMVNLIISWQLHDAQLNLKRILNGSSTVVALLLTITALKIISIYL